MLSFTRRSGVLAMLAGLALTALTASAAAAQNAIITGKVTTAEGAPVPGASVVITSLSIGASAGQNGTYTITVPEREARGQNVQVTARFIGFSPVTRTIALSAGQQTQDFQLKADPFRLDAVITTGVTEATSAKKLSVSVAQLSADQIDKVPATNPVAAIAGKVSGARIAVGRGNPGAAPTIRLRGSTNLGIGSSSPLILVDGVILRSGGIQDFDAQDIENIEILKGAAAASFYGSDAANGVIAITTKRGKSNADNKVSFNFRSEYGQADVQRMVPLANAHPYQLNPDGTIFRNASGQRVTKADGIADNPFPSTGPEAYRNQLETWLENGEQYNVFTSLGLRRGNTNFNTGYTYNRDGGILPATNGLFQQNVRLNVDQAIGAKFDVGLTANYNIAKNDYDPTSADSWFELLQAPPDVDLACPSGKNSSGACADPVPYFPDLPDYKAKNARANPLYLLNNEDYNQRRERILGSAIARWRPTDWLRVDGSYGTDRLNFNSRTYRFRGYLNEGGLPSDGSLNVQTNANQSYNSQLNATATKLFFNNLLSTTRASALYEDVQVSQYNAGGSKLNVSDVVDLGALDPAQSTVNSQLTTQRTRNYFISQTFDLKDRYIVDGLYRLDQSSLFGPEERDQNFYRISGAYRISEDFSLPGIQELKIRAARGTAGLRPGYFDQYEYYSLGGGQITKAQLGNKDLKPAIQTENEFGLNIGFLNRFDLEVVYADRFTEGAFLNVPLSLAQSGGFTQQVQNAADVAADTWEWRLETRVLDTPDWTYSFTLTGDRTRQTIEAMNRAPYRVNAGGQGQDVFYYKAGEPLGIIYGSKWVRSFEDLKKNPANANANPADYVVNPDGFLVLAANRGKPNEVPIRYADATGNQFQIGDVNPDFSWGWANNLRWKRFNMFALFDGVQGGDIYNFTKQWMYQDERHATQGMIGRAQEDKVALAFYSSGLYNGLVASDHFVEDGSYIKLRELSVSWEVPTNMVNRLTGGRGQGVRLALIGRNLYTWTDYTGFDPEVTSGNDFNFRVDGFRYPNFRRISGQIDIRF
jgi:TonB-linked SusC/RagA family outer membrane protein